MIIKAVVFDFDGLIIDTETAWFHCYREALLKYHVDLSLEVFGQGVGTYSNVLRQFIEEKAGKDAVADVVKRAREMHYEATLNLGAREGVREYLAEAKDLGLAVGLASSSNRDWIDGFLKKLDLADYFDVIKSRDDVKNVKPDPELYQQAIEALGVRPEEALAFEDSENGAIAAKTAGLTCVIVPNPVTEDLRFSNYDLRLHSMADQPLTDLLKNF